MKRFLKELRYFWQQVRDGYPRQRELVETYNDQAQFMSLNLPAMSDEHCLAIAVEIARRSDSVMQLFSQLKSRVGRWPRTKGPQPDPLVLLDTLRRNNLTPLQAKIALLTWLKR